MLNIKQQQTIKFFALCLFSIIGLVAFIKTGGTLEKALWIYLGFWILARIHMLTHHRWLGHNEINVGIFGRIFFLWVLISCNLVKPLHYIVCHRLHHKYSDTSKDPHANSVGFWNLLIGNLVIPKNAYVHMKDVFNKKDILFVNKYFYYLYALNLMIFYAVDPHIVMLSFLLLNLKILINATIFNYLAHGGKNGTAPINMPIWMLIVFGYWGEHNHKDHHEETLKFFNELNITKNK